MSDIKSICRKWIPGWTGLYAASSDGRIWSANAKRRKQKWKRLKESLIKGYLSVTLSRPRTRKTIRVHTLVALAFLGEPKDGQQVNHKNFRRTDNRPINLEWCSISENRAHQTAHGRSPNGEGHGRSKFTWETVKAIRIGRKMGMSLGALARNFGPSKTQVKRICSGENWQIKRPNEDWQECSKEEP